MGRGRQTLVVHQVVDGTKDERQRRAQFVGDIGEEAQTFLVEFLFLEALALLEFERTLERQPSLVGTYHPNDESGEGKRIGQEGPPGAPKRWRDGDVELCRTCLVPVLATQLGTEDEGIVSGTKATEYHIVVACNVVPLVVHAPHHVGIFDMAGLRKVANGIGKVKRVLLIAGTHTSFPVGNELLNLGLHAHGMIGFAGDNLHLGDRHIARDLTGLEAANALCRTEAEDTIGSREGSARRKAMQLMQVGLAVVVALSCTLVETRKAGVGAHPDASVGILLESKHMVVGKALLTSIAGDTKRRLPVGCRFQEARYANQAIVGSHPQHLSVEVANGLVNLKGNMSFGRNQVMAGIGMLVVDAGPTAQGGEQQLMVVEREEPGDGNREETADGRTRHDAALLVAIDARLATNPDAMQRVLVEGMDVGTLSIDSYMFESARASTETKCTLVVNAQPNMAVAVGHHAAGQRMATPHLRLSRPSALHPAVGPQHQFVVTGHPETSVCVGSHGIDRTRLPLDVAIVEQIELRTLFADEIDSRAMIAHPDVAIFILCQAARIERRDLDAEILVIVGWQRLAGCHEVVGIDYLDASHVGSHPECAVAHLDDVVNIVIEAIGIEGHTRENTRHGIEEHQSTIAAHPHTLAVVEADATHVVAWKS